MGKFSWTNLLGALPAIIAGAQSLLAGQPGATKKQQVLNWVGFGEAVAATADPQLAPVFNLLNTTIDGIVAAFHAQNAPGFGSNSAPAAPTA